MNLDAHSAEEYWQAITMLEAQDILLQLKVADFPNMKKQDRDKLHKSIHKQAYPKLHDSNRQVSMSELALMVSR